MDIQKEREAFKAWFKKEYLGIDNLANQGDDGAITRRDYAYVGWQAAKAQAVPEWISVKDQLPPSDPYNREYWVYETLNNKVQHDYWVCPDTGLDQDFEPFFNNWPREVTHWMPMVKYPKPPVQAQEPAND